MSIGQVDVVELDEVVVAVPKEWLRTGNVTKPNAVVALIE